MLKKWKLNLCRFALAVFAVFALPSVAAAESGIESGFAEMLLHVHETHPQLLAARASLDAAGADRREAQSGFYPTAHVRAGASSHITEPGAFGALNGETADIGLSVTQPLYRGGRTTAHLRAAEIFVEIAREHLKETENTVLLEAVAVHIALVREEKDLRLREKNIENLQQHLEAEQLRLDLGAATRTDVNQARARLAGSEAEAQRARGRLETAKARFLRVTGKQPEYRENAALPAAVLTARLPSLSSVETALEAAFEHHPLLRAARLEEEANRAAQRAASGERYPELSLTGQTRRTYSPAFAPGETYQDQSQLGLEAVIPLYSGGAVTARVNRARHDGNRLRMQSRDTEREIAERVAAVWEELKSAKAEKQARRIQLEAEEEALSGTRAEYELGARTALDVLDAERDYLDAGLALLTARHDVVLAEYRLLAATGQMRLDTLSVLATE